MKNFIIFLPILFFPSFILSQNYLNETSKWYTVHSDGFDNWWEFSNLEIDGDTTINGLNYFKIKKKYTYVYIGPFWDQFEVTEGVSQLYLREENKKIYRFHNNSDLFIIDFDLTIGDSLNSYFGKEYITEIDSFEFNGEMRKIFRTDWEKEVYEGIGTSIGLFNGVNIGGDEIYSALTCYSQYEETLSLNDFKIEPIISEVGEYLKSCDSAFVTAIDLIQKQNHDLIVFPNPVHGKTFHVNNIHFEIDEIEMISIDGKRQDCFFEKNNDQVTVILKTKIPDGVYLLKLKSGQLITSNKIIIAQ